MTEATKVIAIRVPRALAVKVSAAAEKRGESVNAMLNRILAEVFGYDPTPLIALEPIDTRHSEEGAQSAVRSLASPIELAIADYLAYSPVPAIYTRAHFGKAIPLSFLAYKGITLEDARDSDELDELSAEFTLKAFGLSELCFKIVD